MFYIYCIKNNLNNKTYIGERRCPENKLPETDKYMGSGYLLRNAFKKYGIENFSKSILAITEIKENIDILEKLFINLYRSEGKAEYNIADGGTGGDLGDNWRKSIKKSMNGIFTKEMKEKLSESHKGQIPYNKGKTNIYSYETRIKMGIKNKGRKWWTDGKINVKSKNKPDGFYPGRTVSPETAKRISESHIGHILSEETKNKIREINKIRNKGLHKNMTWKVINGKRVWLNKGEK